MQLTTLAVEEQVVPSVACEAPEINPVYRGRAHRHGYGSAKTSGDVSWDKTAR